MPDLCNPSFLLPADLAVSGDHHDPLAQRQFPEPPHPYRAPFSRDYSRILHARAFRRLAGKTHVFTRRPAESDHVRSRLTHTLEVAQVARTTAQVLGLNPQLAETLALVHDIGHPPFGHAGEKALDEALRAHGLGFDHNLHALRIVTGFEDRYPGFPGLNLTLGVREGIIKHSRDYTESAHPELSGYFLDQFPPLEAQLIDIVDEIAYLTADMEDGLESEILHLPELIAEVDLFAEFYAATHAQYSAAPARLLTYEALKRMMNALVTDLMRTVAITLADVRQAPHRLARLSHGMEERRRLAKAFLFRRLYESPAMLAEHEHAHQVISALFRAMLANPKMLPPDHQALAATDGLPRTIADYLAGMTDSYIEQAWQRLRLAH